MKTYDNGKTTVKYSRDGSKVTIHSVKNLGLVTLNPKIKLPVRKSA